MLLVPCSSPGERSLGVEVGTEKSASPCGFLQRACQGESSRRVTAVGHCQSLLGGLGLAVNRELLIPELLQLHHSLVTAPCCTMPHHRAPCQALGDHTMGHHGIACRTMPGLYVPCHPQDFKVHQVMVTSDCAGSSDT